MSGALEDLKVVELRQGIAAAYCGMLMGDLGAQVVIVQDSLSTEEPDPPLDPPVIRDKSHGFLAGPW